MADDQRDSRVLSGWNRVLRTRALFVHGPYTVGVIVAIVSRDGQILLVQKRIGHPAQWGLPEGFVSQGEDLSSAARKQLSQATGFHADICDEHMVAAWRDPKTRHLAVLFKREIDYAEVVNRRPTRRIVRCEWISLSTIPALTRESKLAFLRLFGGI